MDDWQSVGDGTRVKSLREGKVIVLAPDDLKLTVVPLFCPLCELPMLTREDGHSYRKINCCERCDMRWASTKEYLSEDFKLVKQTKEWKEYLKDRVIRSRQLIKLK